MSKNITNVIPFKFDKQEVRTLLIDNQPWFVAKDVIASLEYAKTSNPARVVDHVPAQWKGVNPIHTLGGEQQMLMLSEQGLYFFIGRSDKEKALPFQMWIAGDVLPAIRKHGRYSVHAAWWEVRTYRNKIDSMLAFAKGFERIASEPQRYAVKLEDAA